MYLCALAGGLVWDLAIAIGGNRGKMKVTRIHPESRTVHIWLETGVCSAGIPPGQVAKALKAQADNRSSQLMGGIWTRYITSLQILDFDDSQEAEESRTASDSFGDSRHQTSQQSSRAVALETTTPATLTTYMRRGATHYPVNSGVFTVHLRRQKLKGKRAFAVCESGHML